MVSALNFRGSTVVSGSSGVCDCAWHCLSHRAGVHVQPRSQEALPQYHLTQPGQGLPSTPVHSPQTAPAPGTNKLTCMSGSRRYM